MAFIRLKLATLRLMQVVLVLFLFVCIENSVYLYNTVGSLSIEPFFIGKFGDMPYCIIFVCNSDFLFLNWQHISDEMPNVYQVMRKKIVIELKLINLDVNEWNLCFSRIFS
jgi:hypothetical protein